MNRELVKKIALPIGILFMGILIMVVLTKLRTPPKKEAPAVVGAMVATQTASLGQWEATVRATATVQPAREISVIPQVSGSVRYISDSFVEGGFFKKGQVMFKIDDTDYRLALRGAEAAKAQAEVELETIKSRAGIARKEWEIMTGGKDGEDGEVNPLVLYEPQMKNAQAAHESASAKVELAKLNLERTTLTAPFDCRVRQRSIDLGQYVRSGTTVATIAGTAYAEVIVPLRREDLDVFDIPGHGALKTGSEAIVTVPGTETTWTGRVVRSTGEVDQKSRMVRVVVEVEDPYGLRSGNPPLMSGSFANVTIKGKVFKDVVAIPRGAIRDGGTVWTMSPDDMLEIKQVEVARYEGDRAIVRSGLDDGDKIVLTKLSGAAPGMKLRTEERTQAPIKPESEAPANNGAMTPMEEVVK